MLLGNCDSEIIAHVCEFAELIIDCDMNERDMSLDAAIVMAEILRSEK